MINPNYRLLVISTSTIYGSGYLEYIIKELKRESEHLHIIKELKRESEHLHISSQLSRIETVDPFLK